MTRRETRRSMLIACHRARRMVASAAAPRTRHCRGQNCGSSCRRRPSRNRRARDETTQLSVGNRKPSDQRNFQARTRARLHVPTTASRAVTLCSPAALWFICLARYTFSCALTQVCKMPACLSVHHGRVYILLALMLAIQRVAGVASSGITEADCSTGPHAEYCDHVPQSCSECASDGCTSHHLHEDMDESPTRVFTGAKLAGMYAQYSHHSRHASCVPYGVIVCSAGTAARLGWVIRLMPHGALQFFRQATRPQVL